MSSCLRSAGHSTLELMPKVSFMYSLTFAAGTPRLRAACTALRASLSVGAGFRAGASSGGRSPMSSAPVPWVCALWLWLWLWLWLRLWCWLRGWLLCLFRLRVRFQTIEVDLMASWSDLRTEEGLDGFEGGLS